MVISRVSKKPACAGRSMKIVPFNNLVLVIELEKVTTTASSSAIIIPEKHIGRYVKYKVLAVGSRVDWIKEGDIVLGNPTPKDEVVNREGHKLINSADLFARMEENE